MRVEAAFAADIVHVANRMRERDREELMAVSPFTRHYDLVHALATRYDGHPDAMAFHGDDGPIGIGGMIQQRPNVATLMFFATDDLPKIGSDLTRFIKQRLFPGYIARGTHRIECASLDGYEEVHRWLGVLGLTREATMLKYGRNGETYVQFSWTKEG